jgi:hypothetical protein
MTSVGVLALGAAIGAQLETIRAGSPAPRSAEKASRSEPDVGADRVVRVR